MSIVKEKREALGISMTELSKRTGLSLVKLSRIENGHREVTIGDLRPLARAFACSVEDLLPTEPRKRKKHL